MKNIIKALLIITGLFLSVYATTTYAGQYLLTGEIQELDMLGAPTNSIRYERSIYPETDSLYKLGDSTKAWSEATSDQFCLTGDSCITSWPTGGGTGGSSVWSTSTPFLYYYNGDNSFVIGNNATTSDVLFEVNGKAKVGNDFFVGGNMGIGTTSPQTLLHIEKAQNATTELRLYNPNKTGTNTKAILRIGVGTSTSNLQDLKDSFSIGAYGDNYSAFPRYTDAGVFLTNIDLDGGLVFQAVNGGLHFGTNDHADADKMTITDAGYIGIGTTTPAYKLDVYGNTRIDGDLIADNISMTGDFSVSSNNSTEASPRVGAFTDLSSGEAVRLQFGDYHNAFQNGYARDLQLYSYWGLVLTGGMQNVGNGFNAPSFSKTLDYGVLVKSETAGAGTDGGSSGNLITTFGVMATTSQTADLTAWLDSSENKLAVVDANGNFGIGTSTPAYKLDVYGNVRIDGELTVSGNSYLSTISSGVWNGTEIEPEYIALDEAGTATYDDLQDWFNTTQSAGKITGGAITDNGDGTLAISAGTGFVKITDSDIGSTNWIDWAASSSIALADNDTNYLYIEYSGGSPCVGISNSLPSDKNTNIMLGLCYRDGTDLHITSAGQYVANYAKNTFWKDIEINGKFQRVNGIIISETGTRNFALTAGAIYAGQTKVSLSAFDSSIAGTFTYYYRDGSGGWTKVATQTQIDNTHYDDGSGTLATLSNSTGWRTYYGVHWVYMDADGDVFALYGQDDYSLTAAQNAQPPTTIPDLLSDIGGLVGKIIIEKDASSFEKIESAFDVKFTPSVVSSHNELAGLQGGTADEYYHLSSSEYTEITGWLDDVVLGSDGSLSGIPELTVTSTSSLGTIISGVWNGTSISASYIDDAFILNTGDIGTGVYDFGGATSLEIPNGTAPVVDITGEIALDTTDNQLLVADGGGTARVIPLEKSLFAVTIASTSEDWVSGGSLPIPRWIKDGRSLTKFRCWVEDGTSIVVNVSDGTNDTETITCATTVTSDDDVATNDTFTAGEKWELQFGTITGTPDYLVFEAYGYITRE